MAGTYIGTPHGGNDFTGASGSDVQKVMAINAARNIAAASDGGKNKVTSADGKRVLFDPKTQTLTRDGKVVDKPKTTSKGGGKGKGKSGGGKGGGKTPAPPTGGPGVPSVGAAPTTGPGLGIVTPNITNTTGHLIQVGSGPGNAGAGKGAGKGAGNVVVVGPMAPKDLQLERTGGGHYYESAGAISDVGWAHTVSGYTVVPSTDAKERMEDDIFQEIGWQMRNNWGPTLRGGLPNAVDSRPFPSFLGDRSNYGFNPVTNEWTPNAGTVKRIGGSF